MPEDRPPVPRQSQAPALLALLLSTAACGRVGYRALEPRPNAGLSTRAARISARVERIHVGYWQQSANTRVDVHVVNEGKTPLHVEPERIDLAVLGRPSALVDAAVQEGDKDLDPGEGGTYRLTLPRAPIESGAPYVLRLHPAVNAPADAIEPLPLVNPAKPHLGYGPPADSTWVFVARIGGGAIRRDDVTAGLGGIEVFTGPQFGRFSFGLSAMIGAGSIGGEVRYRFEPAKVLAIVPFAGYGYYPIAGIVGLNVGHGGRVGAELQFSLGKATRFGWARSGGRMGLFAHAGPVYLRVVDSVGIAAQGGLTFGFF
ncbi:hypothetical protein [Polyangium jinanense]|uniref:Lipoprotein n=1 Tax=Polyangium jinanense TaxID=2829994 RepID=A0A9X4AUP9_9BACT|nr:hypothetical protein [Polyangium jinanense]MDC3956443.1 hypothetical protein [Polyangium jinanense]MDC3985474.1 hypothetical protein [Polyangium jinanense]